MEQLQHLDQDPGNVSSRGIRLSLRRLRYEHHDLILRRRLFAGLLQALRSIDGTANDRVVDPARKSDVANGDSTAVEPEAHAAGMQAIGTAFRVEGAHLCSYGERGTAGIGGVVGARLRRAPKGHDAIAD